MDAGALVAALKRSWDVIRAHHPEVPPVVLAFGTGSTRRATRRKLAHFAPIFWWLAHDDSDPDLDVSSGEPLEPVEPPVPSDTIDDDVFMAQLAAAAESLLRGAQQLSRDAAASVSEVLITDDGLAGSANDVMGLLVHEAAHAIAYQRGIKDTSRQGRYHNRRFKAIAEEIGLDVSRDPDRGWTATALSDPTAGLYRDARRELADALRHRERQSPPPALTPGHIRIVLVCECGPRHRLGSTVSTIRGAICGVCGGGVLALPPG